MKTNYVTPSIELIEMEIEEAVLQNSPTGSDSSTSSLLESFEQGGIL
ncbi:MAG: hypothetical protein SNI45_05775 [Rikenellaceae bacterium]